LGKINDALVKSDKESNSPTSTKKASTYKVYDRKAREKESSEVIRTVFKKRDSDKKLISLFEPQSFEAEQFKHLRTNILFPVSGKLPRSIMVTSAVPGEGKSFVASNLAVSIAQNIDQHVLLMDCDIRNATIHRNFGFDDVAGLSEYLSMGMSLSSLLLKTEMKKLSIFPGGKPPQNPAELMSSNLMSRLLEELTSKYSDRHIIIDSPPPHLTSETSVIARQVDGILVVVKSGSTDRKLVEELLEMMGKEKVLGIVLNWFDMSSMEYYGYNKYSRYRKS